MKKWLTIGLIVCAFLLPNVHVVHAATMDMDHEMSMDCESGMCEPMSAQTCFEHCLEVVEARPVVVGSLVNDDVTPDVVTTDEDAPDVSYEQTPERGRTIGPLQDRDKHLTTQKRE